MKPTPRRILRTYLTLMLLSTLASSLIWGINTLFLLDSGLSITAAFAANAFFTLGQVIFEIPTGIVADTIGRRVSYLLGTITLFITTVGYFLLWQAHAPFILWAIVSLLLGLGFTFFSGATEAWLVDGLKANNYEGHLESAFAKGQIVGGIAMLVGTVGGGLLAQITNLGIPYLVRAALLGITMITAFILMHDEGFKPRKSARVSAEIHLIWRASLEHGFGNKAVRNVMLTGPFILGIGIYGFYALQPYLLELYGKPSYAIAGLAAAIAGCTQIIGGLLVPQLRRYFKRRTSIIALMIGLSAMSLLLMGLIPNFWVVLALLVIWAIAFAASMPVRQAYINALIPSAQRATILSSDNLLGSAGGIVTQPSLGKVADVYSYPASYVVSGFTQLFALPFVLAARRNSSKADKIE